MLQQICSTKEEPDILLLLKSLKANKRVLIVYIKVSKFAPQTSHGEHSRAFPDTPQPGGLHICCCFWSTVLFQIQSLTSRRREAVISETTTKRRSVAEGPSSLTTAKKAARRRPHGRPSPGCLIGCVVSQAGFSLRGTATVADKFKAVGVEAEQEKGGVEQWRHGDFL